MPHYLCWTPSHQPHEGLILRGHDPEDAAESYARHLYEHEPSDYHKGAEVFTRKVHDATLSMTPAALLDEPKALSDLTQAWDVTVEDWDPLFRAEPA